MDFPWSLFTGTSFRADTPLQLVGGLNLQEEMAPPLSHPSGETLEESMARLERGLTSGTLLLQFEVRIYKHVYVCGGCTSA